MSAETKWTPGPWWLHKEYSTLYVEGKARDPRVVQEVAAIGPKEGGYEQQEADARLIAAAPELYEALEKLWLNYKGLADSGDCGDWVAEDTPEGMAALAALAKARGEV